jgi:hypothetical protein
MKSIFDKATYDEVIGRIDALKATTQPVWGKMNVGQMLAHCNEPLQNQLGKKQSPRSGNFLIRFFFKKLLYNDKPYGKGLPTAPSFVIKAVKDFEKEKTLLTSYVKEAHQKGVASEWPEHPAFGKFTPEQNGQMVYKHVDHHLQQFGV